MHASRHEENDDDESQKIPEPAIDLSDIRCHGKPPFGFRVSRIHGADTLRIVRHNRLVRKPQIPPSHRGRPEGVRFAARERSGCEDVTPSAA